MADEQPQDLNQVVRYTQYAVFTRADAADGSAEQRASEIQTWIDRAAAEDITVRGLYDASEFRAESDLMYWAHAERPEQLQQAGRAFAALDATQGLVKSWSGVGVHRAAEFSKSHAPAYMTEGKDPKGWITVYPFVRSYEWYLLSDEERRTMLRDHGIAGRKFPDVLANTVAAFALGDYEWLLSFESDDLLELVDMMRELRYTEARLHVRDELPFHVGRRVEAAEFAELLG